MASRRRAERKKQEDARRRAKRTVNKGGDTYLERNDLRSEMLKRGCTNIASNEEEEQ